MKSYIFTLLLVPLTLNCGGSVTVSPSSTGTVSPIASPTPTVTPTPAPAASVTPQCKSLSSVWKTANLTVAPENQLMGVYVGGPSNGPVYTLDLSKLKSGDNGFQPFEYDATHTCYYDVEVGTSDYIVKSFQGCDNPNLGTHTQCNYCPYSVGDYLHINILYSFNLTCNSISITDTSTGRAESYK